MKVLVLCPCGDEFETSQDRIDAGRGKYCSKPCMYKYRTRPSGLRYNIVAENRGWFKVGCEGLSGEDNPGWKGDDISYRELHRWIRKERGEPEICEGCGTTEGLIEWANKSHEYKRELLDWLSLCRFCHKAYDKEHRGAAVNKYGAEAVQNGTR
mgnify:CR=1 FL=1